MKSYIFIVFKFKDDRSAQVPGSLSGNFAGHDRCEHTFLDDGKPIDTQFLHSPLPVEEFVLFVENEEN